MVKKPLKLEHLYSENESLTTNQKVVDLIIDNIRKKSVILYGQGIYDGEKNLKKIELLSRLKLEDGNIISPFLFMNVIRRNGFSREFDFIIMEQAFESMKGLISDQYKYTINIHKDTMDSPGFLTDTKDIVERTGVNPEQIIFEILEDNHSECSFTQDKNENIVITPNGGEDPSEELTMVSQRFNQTLLHLRDSVGIQLSIDDFPMGSNCMSGIRNLQGIDYVKLDGLWLLTMLNNCKKMYLDGETRFIQLISSVITDIKQQFPHMVFVAERVENQYLFELFKKIDTIQYFQGFYLGKPCDMKNYFKHKQ